MGDCTNSTWQYYVNSWMNDSLNESGEFKNKTVPDAEKTTYQATTKGNIVGITREIVVNDDIAAVMPSASAGDSTA